MQRHHWLLGGAAAVIAVAAAQPAAAQDLGTYAKARLEIETGMAELINEARQVKPRRRYCPESLRKPDMDRLAELEAAAASLKDRLVAHKAEVAAFLADNHEIHARLMVDGRDPSSRDYWKSADNLLRVMNSEIERIRAALIRSQGCERTGTPPTQVEDEKPPPPPPPPAPTPPATYPVNIPDVPPGPVCERDRQDLLMAALEARSNANFSANNTHVYWLEVRDYHRAGHTTAEAVRAARAEFERQEALRRQAEAAYQAVLALGVKPCPPPGAEPPPPPPVTEFPSPMTFPGGDPVEPPPPPSPPPDDRVSIGVEVGVRWLDDEMTQWGLAKRVLPSGEERLVGRVQVEELEGLGGSVEFPFGSFGRVIFQGSFHSGDDERSFSATAPTMDDFGWGLLLEDPFAGTGLFVGDSWDVETRTTQDVEQWDVEVGFLPAGFYIPGTDTLLDLPGVTTRLWPSVFYEAFDQSGSAEGRFSFPGSTFQIDNELRYEIEERFLGVKLNAEVRAPLAQNFDLILQGHIGVAHYTADGFVTQAVTCAFCAPDLQDIRQRADLDADAAVFVTGLFLRAHWQIGEHAGVEVGGGFDYRSDRHHLEIPLTPDPDTTLFPNQGSFNPQIGIRIYLN